MKKLLLLLGCISFALNAQNSRKHFINTATKQNTISTLQRHGLLSSQSVSGLIREGFENTAFPPAGWQTVDVAGPEVFLRSSLIPHSGVASAFCLYEQNAPYGEDWLIMPKFNVVSSDSLHFWLGITDPGYPDSLYVLISTTDSALSSFTNKELTLADGNGYPGVHYGFVKHSISLAAYAGQSVYVAFRNWNINGDGVSIDDVQLGTPPAADVASVSWDKPHVLGDTTQSVIATVKNTGTASQTFNVTMTITGGYSSTKAVTSLAPNATQQVSFASWTPTVMGTNIVKMYTQLAADGYLLNDTLVDTLHISHISNDDIKAISVDMLLKTGNAAQTPKATVRNNGFNTETFTIKMTITGGYSSTATVTSLAPFATQQVSFASWTPSVIGTNNISVYSQLGADGDKTNDTVRKTIQVFPEFTNYGWSSHPALPNKYFGNSSAFYHQGVYPNDTSIVFSLCGVDSNGAFSTENTAFSSLTNSWSARANAPLIRYDGSSQTVNGKIYFLGGFGPGYAPVKNNDVYDIMTNTWSVGAAIPEKLADFGSGVYKDSLIYIIGGMDSTGTPTNNVYVYDTYNNSWTSATSKTGTATWGIRAGVYKNKIVAVGGTDGNAPNTDATLGVINPSSPATITWSALPNYPGSKVMHHSGSSVYGDQQPLVIFTGGDTTGYSTLGVTYYTTQTWGYDLSSNSWKIGPEKITGTNDNSNLVAAVFNDSLYMISVGGHGSTMPLNVNEWLNLGPDTSNMHTTDIKHTKLNGTSVGVYPNPFGEKTSIALSLDGEQNVSINVYDISGRFVAELVNKNLSEGNHCITWNAASSASGIYIARIMIGDNILTKKLIKN
ncbi:MAG: choice-of-anchor J domain-containing protein [Bacteroidia bacterium]